MKKNFLLLVAVVFHVAFAHANEEVLSKVKKASESYLSTHFMNGVYSFCDANNKCVKGAQGVYNYETKKTLAPAQVMPIASTTKSMTAVAILKLQDAGKLNVSDNIAKHLNSGSEIWNNNAVPAWATDITIHNLLTHTSGLPEYFMQAKIDVKKTLPEIIKDIANFAGTMEVSFRPGSKFEYCNTNFILLGLIIEKVSGKNLADFYNDEIFLPLGMNNTRLITLAESVEHQTKPFSLKNYPVRYFVTPNATNRPEFTVAMSEFIMIPYADGGVASTTEDLIKWNKNLHSGKVLSKETYKLMTAGHYEIPTSDDSKNYTGYGLFITDIGNGEFIYHHPGKALAIRSESGYIPSKDIYFAVLSNVMIYIPKEMEGKIDMSKQENQVDIGYYTQSIFNSLR